MEKDGVVLVDPWETYVFHSVGAQLLLRANDLVEGSEKSTLLYVVPHWLT